MSYPQPKLPSSDELIDKHSVANFSTPVTSAYSARKQALAQVKRYK